MKSWIISLIGSLTLFFISSQCVEFHKDAKVRFGDTHRRKPMLLVPGILGSRMQAKLNMSHSPGYFCARVRDWFEIWLSMEELTPFYIDCWVHDISLVFNASEKTFANHQGVKTRIPDFGSTEGFDYLDVHLHYAPGSKYFIELDDYLVDLGYERGDDLKGAPYDWRSVPSLEDELMKNFTKLVENNYYQHFNQKVVILGHSMGNMFIYYFLKQKPQEWKDKFIDSFVSISSPYIGSVKALKAIVSGEAEGHAIVLPRLKLRKAARTFPSSFFLLPRPGLWPADKKKVVVTLKKNYTVHEYEALFKRMHLKFGWEIYKSFGTELGDLSAPNVPVHCVYSTQIPTPEVLLYDPDLFPDGPPAFVTGDGDGTVNTFSSSYCLNWKEEQTQPVYDAPMPGNTHTGILSDKTLHEYIRRVVTAPEQENNFKNVDIL